MSVSSQQFETYVPVYDVVPEEWDEARPFLVEMLKKITNSLNSKEVGFFLDEELLSGKAFIPGATLTGNNPGLFRQVLRKVIDFGALPNAGLKSVPHGIVFDANFTLVQLFGAATDPVNLLAIDIGHAAAAPNQVEIYLDANNINIVTGSNRSSYTRCYVVIEYMQEL